MRQITTPTNSKRVDQTKWVHPHSQADRVFEHWQKLSVIIAWASVSLLIMMLTVTGNFPHLIKKTSTEWAPHQVP
ncbi:uncharacterized protein BO95DRAFT_445682 [Aspergillus brunneoviolaceus CBS 621.78]|uniref:Uncharacterized protein n=1 Tax=Aspergillus brunneoviolaceus CBS 621.78 TaxID=1450534 RepID=A0ACD1G0T4_9EURO|nr:hypothetical protein BO95DRAFT_445682 [Aspergillus brunneoviolaceus CBS 621.78]RAH42766.1 hypothetical protein BO95DRAFT_445682 [Aspergillus brunneoviolaceus CBS 621.78]